MTRQRPAIVPAPGPSTKRISLRHNAHDGPSDVVGHLVAANADWLVLLPEDRPAVWVPRAEVGQIRDVPERIALPASSAAQVARVLEPTWPGLRRARLGGWVLRAGNGATRRANSVLALGEPGLGFADALAAADGWLGKPALLQALVPGDVADQATAAGYRLEATTAVLVRAATAVTADEAVGFEVVSFDEPDAAWLATQGSVALASGWLAEATAAPARYLRIGAEAGGRITRVGHWAVLGCLAVPDGGRGEGLGRGLMSALMASAERQGARHIAAHVEVDNPAVRPLLEAEGFVEHHRYGYFRAAGA